METGDCGRLQLFAVSRVVVDPDKEQEIVTTLLHQVVVCLVSEAMVAVSDHQLKVE